MTEGIEQCSAYDVGTAESATFGIYVNHINQCTRQFDAHHDALNQFRIFSSSLLFHVAVVQLLTTFCQDKRTTFSNFIYVAISC